MRIAMTGASGLVGGELTRQLEANGHEVVPMVRQDSEEGIRWDPVEGVRDSNRLDGMDAIVHLAGASIGDGRWSGARKRLLVSSRVDGARSLVRAALASAHGPRIIVSASAIGFYGHRGSDVVEETSASGTGFLAELCRQWESAFDPARDAGIRVVSVRTGVVLSTEGGALPKMLTPIRWGVGGRIGSGEQWVSWITNPDLASIYRWALEDGTAEGPVNGVAPAPETNQQLTDALGRKLGRPTVLPLPEFAARLLLGEMADELLLASTRVRPGVLLERNHRFHHPDLDGALDHVLG